MSKILKIAIINFTIDDNILSDNKFKLFYYKSQKEFIKEINNIKYDVIINYVKNYNLDEFKLHYKLDNSINKTTTRFLLFKNFIKNYKIIQLKYSDVYNINVINKLYERLNLLYKIKTNINPLKPAYNYDYKINPYFLKRLFDVIISLLFIIILSPVYLINFLNLGFIKFINLEQCLLMLIKN